MDVRAFYTKVREVMAQIEDEFAVIVSNPTEDGGRAGVLSEVTRQIAARLIAEGKASLATAEQAAQFRAEIKAQYEAIKALENKRRMALETYASAGLEALQKLAAEQK